MTKIKKINNKKLYDENWADWVDMKVYGPASRWLRVLIRDIFLNVDKKQIKSVLDVGCGEGTVTYEIARMLPKAVVTGIDFSRTGVKLAHDRYKLPNLNFKHDLKSNLLDRNHDLVTSFEVLEHVEEWKKLLIRITRSSNKYVLLSFPTGRMRSFEKNVGHLRNFRKDQVENFMLSKGFKPITIYYAGFPFFSPIYREFCNLTNASNNSFTNGINYSLGQKLISAVLFLMFSALSTKYKYGDQFCGLFKRNSEIVN
ncbi:MAG: class I SAM-dependent methyltransferase [Patescibacteria group bacterium]